MNINKNIDKSCSYILNNNYSKTQLNINEYGYEHHKDLTRTLANHIQTFGISKYSSVKENAEIRLKNNILKFLDEKSIDDKNIILSNSGDINILSFFRLFRKQDNKNIMIQFIPTYTQYENIAFLENWTVKNISIYENESISSFTSIIKKIKLKKNGKYLFFICNPNNPTGTQWNIKVLNRLFRYFKNSFFIIDETYIDFSVLCKEYKNPPLSVCKNINKYTNVAIMRSFSKAFGLAGLRLSYIISSYKIIQQLEKLISHKDIIELSKVAGSVVLENINFYRLQTRQMFDDKDKLLCVLDKLNVIYKNCYSNFICIKLKNNGERIYSQFLEENIIIKKFDTNSKMRNWIRITIQSNTISKVIQILKQNIYYIKTKKYKTGFIDGCFDGFHFGHIMALSYAKENSKLLICSTHTDDDIYNNKNKKTMFSLEDRLYMLNSSIFIDKVSPIVEYNTNKQTLINNEAQIFFHGEDCVDIYPLDKLNEENLLYIYPRTLYISSSSMRERVKFVIENNKSFVYEMGHLLPPTHYLNECHRQIKKIKNNIKKNKTNIKNIVVSGNFDLFGRQHIEQIINIKAMNPNGNIVILLNENMFKPNIFSLYEQKLMIESCKYIDSIIQSNTKRADYYINIQLNDLLNSINSY